MSVVGNLISFRHTFGEDCEGAMPPNHGSRFRTVDIESGKEVRVEDYFSAEELLAKLKDDSFVKKYVDTDSISNLDELSNAWWHDGKVQHVLVLEIIALRV